MLTEPATYTVAVQGLFAAQKHMVEAGVAGEHICFMGSGREEEDQYVNMVIASFLKNQVTYISAVKGGYAALHDLISEESSLEEHLIDHNPQQCIVCVQNASTVTSDSEECRESTSFFSRLKSNSGLLGKLKTSAQDWKEDLKVSERSCSSDGAGRT